MGWGLSGPPCNFPWGGDLVAPYWAILRDYLSDTPPVARYGVLGVSA